jgi:hypothetical protein
MEPRFSEVKALRSFLLLLPVSNVLQTENEIRFYITKVSYRSVLLNLSMRSFRHFAIFRQNFASFTNEKLVFQGNIN